MSKFIYNLALEYRKRGLNFSIISLTSIDDIYGKELQKENIEVVYLSDRGEKYSVKNIFRLVKKLKSYNVIHANTYPSQIWVACVSIFLKKKRYILTEHATTNNRRKKIGLSILIHGCILNLIKWLTPSKKHSYKFCVINNGINL